MRKIIEAAKRLFSGRNSSLDAYFEHKNPTSLAELESILKDLERKNSLRKPLNDRN